MELTLKLKKVVVMLSNSTDKVYFYYEGNTTFPAFNDEPILLLEVAKNFGVEYVKTEFGIDAEVLDTRLKQTI